VPRPSQVSSPLQALPSSHDVPAPAVVPGWHCAAALHVSAPLHTLPSAHDVPLGAAVLRQNATAVPLPTHASAVHALLSLHGGGTAAA
jgi:hypothetical protein